MISPEGMFERNLLTASLIWMKCSLLEEKRGRNNARECLTSRHLVQKSHVHHPIMHGQLEVGGSVGMLSSQQCYPRAC